MEECVGIHLTPLTEAGSLTIDTLTYLWSDKTRTKVLSRWYSAISRYVVMLS